MSFSPVPSYIFGTMFVGIGGLSLLAPQADYAVFGLPLEPAGSTANTTTGRVSPMIYAKGIREVAVGLTYFALQYRGLDEAVTIFSAILILVAFADGAIVYRHGGPSLKSKAWGHWGGMVPFAGWVAWRANLL